MAIQKYSGQQAITSADNKTIDIAIGGTIDPSRAFATITETVSNSEGFGLVRHLFGTSFPDGNTLRLERRNHGYSSPLTLNWEVVELPPGCSVQHGFIALNGSSPQTVTLASSVDLTRTVVLSEYTTNGYRFWCRPLVRLSDANTLTLETDFWQGFKADSAFVFYHVIEFPDGVASVQQGEFTIANAADQHTDVNQLASAVDPAKTFIIGTATAPYEILNPPYLTGSLYLGSGATTQEVNYRRTATSSGIANVRVHYQTVEFLDDTVVHTGMVSLTSNSSETAAISVDPAKTMVITNQGLDRIHHHNAPSSEHEFMLRQEITAANTLTVSANSADPARPKDAYFQLIEFGSLSVGPVSIDGAANTNAPLAEGSATGDFLPPDIDGAANVNPETPQINADGTVDVPGSEGSGSANAQKAGMQGQGDFVPPSIAGAGSVTAPGSQADGEGSSFVPGIVGAGAGSAEGAEIEGTGTAGVPQIGGAGQAQSDRAQTDGSGSMILPTFEGSAVTSPDSVQASGQGSFTPPSISGAASVSASPAEVSASSARKQVIPQSMMI